MIQSLGLLDWIEHWTQIQPSARAVVAGRAEMTYAELAQTMEAVARRLQHLDVECGQPLAPGATSGVERIPAWLAVHKAGFCIDFRYTDLGQSNYFSDSSKTSRTSDAPQLGETIRRIRDAGEVAFGVFRTSGTTGPAKTCVRSLSSVFVEILQWTTELGLNRNSRLCILRPIDYSGSIMLALAALFAGGTVEFLDCAEFAASASGQHIRERPFDFVLASPVDIREIALLVHGGVGPGCIRNLLFTAEAADKETLEYGRDVLGAKLAISWGTTEGLGSIMVGEEVFSHSESVGRAFAGEEIFTVDDSGKMLPPESLGWIAGRTWTGAIVLSQAAEREIDLGRHVVISDDLGWCSKDGYMIYAGRRQDKDLIDRIFPKTVAMLEGEVRRELGVAEVCIVAANARESSVGVAVQGRLTAGAEAKLNGWARQNGLIIARIREFEQLPRTKTGKTDRDGVRACLADGQV